MSRSLSLWCGHCLGHGILVSRIDESCADELPCRKLDKETFNFAGQTRFSLAKIKATSPLRFLTNLCGHRRLWPQTRSAPRCTPRSAQPRTRTTVRPTSCFTGPGPPAPQETCYGFPQESQGARGESRVVRHPARCVLSTTGSGNRSPSPRSSG